MGDFTLGLDLLAAIVTLFYVARLLVLDILARGDADTVFDSPWATRFEKRSLLNQQIYRSRRV